VLMSQSTFSNGKQYLLRMFFLLIAFMPVVTATLSWSVDGSFTFFQFQSRIWSLPMVAVEFLTMVYAFSSGMPNITLVSGLKTWHRWMLLLALCTALLSAGIAAINPAMAIWGTLVWTIHFCFAGSVAFLVSQLKTLIWSSFWKAFVIGTVSYVALTAVFVRSIPYPQSFPWADCMPGVLNVRHIGYFVGPAIGVAIALYISGKTSANKIIYGTVLTVLTCFGCWTGSRGMFFSLFIAIALSLYVYPILRKLRVWAALIIMMVGAVLASTAIPAPDENFGIFNRIAQASRYSTADNFSSGRIALWKKTISYIVKRPLLGYGAEQFRSNMRPEINLLQPHNLALQILFQWGILGAIGFFSLIIPILVATFKNATSAGLISLPAFFVFITLFAFSMIDGTGYYPFPIVLMILAAICLSEAKESLAKLQST
jgi:O-antigen ligase